MKYVIGLLALLFWNAAFASLIVAGEYAIYIAGPLEKGDDQKFAQILKGKGKKAIVYIDSPGGDVDTAIKIGKSLRSNAMAVSVTNEAQCASACVYVLAGGVKRIVYEHARIIVHRPFLEGAELGGSARYDEFYKRIVKLTNEYFLEMNIPVELANRMLAVPPHQAEELTESELKRYMLNGTDPAFEQQELSSDARKYGISVSELNQRKSDAEKLCSALFEGKPEDELTFFDLLSYMTCSDALMQGLAPRVVSARLGTAIERKAEIERLNHKAQESCIESIFLPEKSRDCALR